MQIESEDMAVRHAALVIAREIVTPVVEYFPPTDTKTITAPSSAFSSAPSVTVPAANHVVDLYLQVGDWLLREHLL